MSPGHAVDVALRSPLLRYTLLCALMHTSLSSYASFLWSLYLLMMSVRDIANYPITGKDTGSKNKSSCEYQYTVRVGHKAAVERRVNPGGPHQTPRT